MYQGLFVLALLFAQTATTYAQQRSTEWVPSTQKITLDGNQLREMRYNNPTLRISAKLYETTTYTVKNSKVVCDNQSADGSKGDWNNFYTVPRAEKAKALAGAIKGVGPASAEYLVDLFLKDKPDSWSEFTRVIRDAERVLDQRGLVQAGWGTKVVETYALENQRSLGYAKSDCRTVVSSETKSRREFVKEHYATVNVLALNLSLLPGEYEVVSVSYDGRRISVESSQTYNFMSDYVTNDGLYAGSAHYTLVLQTARKRTSVKNEIEASNSRLARDGTLRLEHPAYYSLLSNRQFREKCRLYATVSLYAVTGNFWNKKEKLLETRETELSLNNGKTFLRLESANGLSEDQEASLKFTVRANSACPFYNTSSSLERSFGR